jgi:putative transposase
LAIQVGQRLAGEDVVKVMQHMAFKRGQPKFIKTDNGSEFIFKASDKWAYENKISMYSQGQAHRIH